MHLKQVERLAVGLMQKHHLIVNGWKFSFDVAKTRCGCTDYDRKVISLSKYYVMDPCITKADVQNTVLHEIAHVLAGWEAAHGVLWQAIARLIGCDGSRCNRMWRGVPRKYHVTCICGRVCTGRHIVQQRLRRKRCISCNTLRIFQLF